MYIAVVRSGESLASIALSAGVTVDQLMAVNGLPSQDVVPGQALLVPSNRYVVQPGDTLWSLSERTGVSVEALRRANPGSERILYVGRPLRIPQPPKPRIDVLGYLPLTDPGVTPEDIGPWVGAINWVAVFAYIIAANGDVTPIDDANTIDTASRSGARPLLSIANIQPGGAFSPEIARSIITDAAVRERVISTIVELMNQKGYAGVDSDIENIPGDLRAGFVEFLRQLKERMGDRILNIAVPPKYNEEEFGYAQGFDYAGIGRVADRVFVMNYEFHWVGGPPGPIAPVPEASRVMQYAASLIPREKVLNGISTSAYDWELPDTPENRARAWSDDEAVQIAVRNGVPIRYDERAQSPWFRYVEGGRTREVWFEDARSLMAKLRLVRDQGLGGLGIWQLGNHSSQLATLIKYLFTVGGQ